MFGFLDLALGIRGEAVRKLRDGGRLHRYTGIGA